MNDWPDSFDFESDALCQSVFKPFIESELAKLKALDERRPDDITYIFHQHAPRVAEDVKQTCLYMGLSERIAGNMYWAVLPHDIGKSRLPFEIWDTPNKPSEELKALRRTHTNLGYAAAKEALAQYEHPFKDLMLDIIYYHHEKMDGSGTQGLPAATLSTPVQLAAIVEAFDGWQVWRPHYGERDISTRGVLQRMREEKADEFFDMNLFEIFAEMKMKQYKNEPQER